MFGKFVESTYGVVCYLTDFYVNFLCHQVSEQASYKRHPILFEVSTSFSEYILRSVVFFWTVGCTETFLYVEYTEIFS